jgi:hypothetical protein
MSQIVIVGHQLRREAQAAQALVDFLRTPEEAAVIKAEGLESVAP